jgi:fatty acid desaturase
MNKKQWLLAFVLCAFAVLNAYVLYQYGYSGFIELVTANAATVAVLVDLTIALTLVVLWMWNDAKRRGISALPYLGLTLVLGSIGPLLYLLRTAGQPDPALSTNRLMATSMPRK